jgi:hypothetical protein
MSDYVKLATSAGELYLAALAETQANFLKSMTSVGPWTTPTPPPATLPFVVDLPTPREVAEANFSFTEKLLKQQKDFTEKLFAASTPPMSTPAMG